MRIVLGLQERRVKRAGHRWRKEGRGREIERASVCLRAQKVLNEVKLRARRCPHAGKEQYARGGDTTITPQGDEVQGHEGL